MRTRWADCAPEEIERDLAMLAGVRDRVLDGALIEPGDKVVDVGSGTGLLAFGALERVGPNGDVIALDISSSCLDELRRLSNELGTNGRLAYQLGDAAALPLPDASIDVALTRSVLIYVRDKAEAAREFFRVLRPGGRFSLFEPINRRNLRMHDALDLSPLGELGPRFTAWSEGLCTRDHPMVDFDERDLERFFADAGFADLSAALEATEQTTPAPRLLTTVGAPGEPTLLEEWQDAFAPAEVEQLVAFLGEREIPQRYPHLFLTGRKP